MTDKARLTANGRAGRTRTQAPPPPDRLDREAHELGAACHRIMRALVRRATAGDLLAVEQLDNLAADATASLIAAGNAAHAYGYSYTDLADLLGVSRQAARERFR